MRCLPASRSSAAKSRVAFELRPADRWGTDQRGEGHVVRLAMMSSLLAFPNSLVLAFLISGFPPPGMRIRRTEWPSVPQKPQYSLAVAGARHKYTASSFPIYIY